jgi:hypothetical protein
MYLGHSAVALAIESREPRVPIVPLIVACYGPDWASWILGVTLKRPGMSLYTHSVPAVLVGAALAAGAYALLARRPGARWIALAWVLHWPADFFTGSKPVAGVNELVGLHLYSRPEIDFMLEAAVLLVGCWLYARAFATSSRQRWIMVGLGTALIGIQGVMDLALGMLG